MEAVYLTVFEQLVTEVVDQQGLDLPWELKQYTTAVMAEYTNKTPATLDKTFAEQYLTAETDLDCKTVADCALLVYGAWPTYKRHRGIHTEYYKDIGESAYARIDRELFQMMSRHFELAGSLVRATVTQMPVQLVP